LFAQLAQPYFQALDSTMRGLLLEIVRHDEPGFGVMMRYALGWSDTNDRPYHVPTGKRLRPVLLMLCAEAAGGNWQDALPAAAAVEFLHNFSLIHDDIQDNSPTRHNRPTVWKIWGMENAINAGDALFATAYSAMAAISRNVPADRTVKLWQVFNATNIELTRGQHLDMSFEHRSDVSVDDYVSMIKGKTAALLSACAQMGALIAGVNEATAQCYADFGLNIGISFQIRDDILGIWGDPAVTGKSAATDIISRKKSLPVLYGLDKSAELAKVYQRENFGDADVHEAVALLDAVDAQTYAREQEKVYYEKAMTAMETAIPENSAGKKLQTFVDMLFQRVN
jgi:geranylgeranyl diphosphate synthase type I